MSLRTADATTVARLHSLAFADSALARLGLEAVLRYYEWLLSDNHPEAVRLGAWDGSVLEGFAFGGRYNRALVGFLRANRSFLVSSLIQRPSLVFANEVRRAARDAAKLLISAPPPASGAVVSPPSFGVLAIAVRPEAQGRGVGRILMTALENAARERAAVQMHLTVERDNSRAIAFYESLGWSSRDDGMRTLGMTLPVQQRRAEG